MNIMDSVTHLGIDTHPIKSTLKRTVSKPIEIPPKNNLSSK